MIRFYDLNKTTENSRTISRRLNDGSLTLNDYIRLNDLHFDTRCCVNCFKELKPIINSDGLPSYKEYEGYKILRCEECLKKLKTTRNSYNNILNQFGDEALKLFKTKTCGSFENFKRRHGDKASEKFEQFKNRSAHTKEKYIQQYGLEKGLQVWDSYIKLKSDTSKRTLDYWLIQCSGNIVLTKQKLHDFQNNSSLDRFTKRFGEHDGLLLYEENNKKLSVKNYYIKKYGLSEGLDKFAVVYGFKDHNDRMKNSKGFYTHLFYDTSYRTIIFQDQGFKCGICNIKTQIGTRFSLHHIDYIKTNDRRENLIWLCNSCHSKTTFGDREWYTNELKKINNDLIDKSRNNKKIEDLYEKYEY